MRYTNTIVNSEHRHHRETWDRSAAYYSQVDAIQHTYPRCIGGRDAVRVPRSYLLGSGWMIHERK